MIVRHTNTTFPDLRRYTCQRRKNKAADKTQPGLHGCNLNIVKYFRAPPPIAAITLAVALLSPCSARAVGIGEIESLSTLGKPLQLRVGLTTLPAENINNACLSLVAPDPDAENRSSYLTVAKLAMVKTSDGKQHIDLSTTTLFNDAFAILKLQIRCPGWGSVSKELTILPLPDEISPQNITAPEVAAAPAAMPAVTTTTAHKADKAFPAQTASSAARATSDRKRPVKKRRAAHAGSARAKSARTESFQLKLSGDPLDESRIGKISPEERELLLARQKLLDADDQMASFLALQQQVKQLQNELGDIKLKLSQLSANPPAAAPPAQHTPDGSATLPSVSANLPAEKPGYPLLQRSAVAGLMLAILALLLGLRYYNRIKSQRAAAQHRPQSEAITSGTRAAPQITPAPAAAPSRNSKPDAAVAALHIKMPSAPGAAKKALQENATTRSQPPHSPQAKLSEAEMIEAESIMEEAQLYAVHGRPQKAVEIMNELLAQQPGNTGAWLLLLSILSSLNKAEQFSQAVRGFLKLHENHPDWPGIQALGRTLEPSNPLYLDGSAPISAASFMSNFIAGKPRPVGDILLDMGALSTEKMAQYLADFDPKLHGRFGGYLISRKAISYAQLDEALRRQQGVGEETTSLRPGEMPTLQDMEKFLAGFDPKRDGSIADYLIARKALTPAQLEKFMQQQPEATSAETPAASQPAAAADARDSASEPKHFEWESHVEPDMLARGQESVQPPMPDSPDKNKPLEFNIDFGFTPATEKDPAADAQPDPVAPPVAAADLDPGDTRQPKRKPKTE